MDAVRAIGDHLQNAKLNGKRGNHPRPTEGNPMVKSVAAPHALFQ